MKEVEFVRTEGVSLYDAQGIRYIDAVSGTFNLALGYSHPKMVAVLKAQIEKVIHVSSHHTKPNVRALVEQLTAHAPEGLTHGWVKDITGSTANEGAIKMAQKATGKTDIITTFLSHHGQTALTTAISGNAFRREGFPENISPHSIKVPAPYCHRCFYGSTCPSCGFHCIERIDDFIQHASSGRVAAIMIEPILGNGGNIVPPPGWFEALQSFCKQRDIAIIADEVHTGMGRTGEMFASQTFGLKPDILTIGKGLGGIGIPVAAILMRPEFDVLRQFDHSFTSGGNMLSIAAAKATIEIMDEEKILDNVKKNEPVIKKALEGLKERLGVVCDVRGKGFMWGIELADKDGRQDTELVNKVIPLAFDNHNLILRGTRYGFGNVIEFRPALVATEGELLEMIDRMEQSIVEAANLDKKPIFRAKMENTMIGLSYQAPWELEFIERTKPIITAPNDVLVKVAATGICGTDLGIVSGQYFAKPGVILGHEFAGTILAVGDSVKNVKPGDRVYVDPTYYCGTCEPCTSDHQNHCDDKTTTETGVSADGAFAPLYLTSSRFVIPMADTTTFEAASLAEPFSCALTGVNQVKLRPDDKTVVLGAGTMGVMYAHALSLKGIHGTIVDISPERLKLAEQALPQGWNVAESFDKAKAQFKNGRLDVVVDTTSVMVETAIPHLNRGGRIVLVGLRRHKAQIDPGELADKSISLIGSIDSIGTFPLACRLVDQGRLPWDKIITGTFDVKDFRKAFDELGVDLAARRITPSARHLKVLLKTPEFA